MQRHESLQPLSREHHQTLRLARLLQGGEADVDLREALASHRAALQVHFAEEETIGRQAIGQCPEDGILAEQVERMQREHRQIERLIAGVLDGEDGSTGYRRLGEALVAHVRFEERELFNRLQGGCLSAQGVSQP